MTSYSPPGLALLAALLFLVSSGCGGAVYRPASNVKLDLDPVAEINDDDVRKAFEARPQLGKPVRIAYYSFDAARVDELDRMLRAQPGVADVYRIPSLMVSGARRYDREDPWAPKEPFSIKKARLLAARAHCDLLLIFDNGHRIETSANGWVATSVLLFPLLFVPFLDADVDSYLEAYVIDTRNGYLYAHVATDQKGQADQLTIYSGAPDRMVQGQWQSLLAETRTQLGRVLGEEWQRTANKAPLPATVSGDAAVPASQQPAQPVHEPGTLPPGAEPAAPR